MQTIPRDGLTEVQVRELLNSDVLHVESSGFEVRSGFTGNWVDSLRLGGLVQPDGSVLTNQGTRPVELVGGTVSRDNFDEAAHGRCSLEVLGSLEQFGWGKVQVRVWQILSNYVYRARFNLGVYVLMSPRIKVGEQVLLPNAPAQALDATAQTYTVTGEDLRYILNRPVGDNYQVGQGTTYASAIPKALAAAGIATPMLWAPPAASLALPADRVWLLEPSGDGEGGLDYTWLDVINGLLKACNYVEIYFDENGNPCSYVESNEETSPEWTFDADDARTTMVGEDREMDDDAWQVPNAWKFIARSQFSSSLLNGTNIYTYPDAAGLTAAAASLGYLRWKIRQIDAANGQALIDEGNRLVAEDKRFMRTISFQTSPFPLAGHRDRYRYRDKAFSPLALEVRSRDYTIDLLGGDTEHTVEVL